MSRNQAFKKFIVCSLSVAVLSFCLCISGFAAEDKFPSKPITVIIPLSAGGANDTTARILEPMSRDVFGQPMIINCRPGGGGSIGTELVGQAKPDGYTILFGHSTPNCLLPAMEGRSRGPGQLDAISRINILDSVIVVRADSPFKSFKEMIEWARANPGKLTFGMVGGERSWAGMEWTYQCKTHNIDAPIVPFDGGGPQISALLGGHVHAVLSFVTTFMPHYKAGKVRFLANYGRQRDPNLPDLPSTTELGFPPAGPGGIWKAMFAPKGTPRPVIDILDQGFKKMTENKTAIERMKARGDQFNYMSAAEFEKYWRQDYETFKKIAQSLK